MEKDKDKITGFTVGIDASGLRQGGGMTHLIELLNSADPIKYGIKKIVVWGNSKILSRINNRPWLLKIHPSDLDGNFFQRSIWRIYKINNAIKLTNCDLLFVPGGVHFFFFKPYIIMCRNMLPFEWNELLRFGFSLKTIRLLLLRWLQSYTFRCANGVIFLTTYAKNKTLKITGKLKVPTPVISHGINSKFKIKPKLQYSITDYNEQNSYRIIYVSTIDLYKHQWHVVDAVYKVRQKGYSIVLDIIGPAYLPALCRLKSIISKYDQENTWVFYNGEVTQDDLLQKYLRADLGVFASSCENMPNILLETMAAGLPVASSSKGPMPEILGDAGVYFDPERPDDIALALFKLIESPELRVKYSMLSYRRALQYSWEKCADETFNFITKTL